ncbi:MAG: ABC transporter permease [Ignavibacteria bacterium]
MGYEIFIAGRYLRSRHKLNFITIISIISTFGVALGVAALIVVLSVFNGFGSLVTSILVKFDPHIRITALSTESFNRMTEVETVLKNSAHVKSYYPYVSGKTIIKRGDLISIVDVKGMNYEPRAEEWGVAPSIHLGRYEFNTKEGGDGILIGFNLANRLQCTPGDSLYLTSFNDITHAAVSLSMPGVKKYIITGIFESNNNDYDLKSVFISLESSRELFGMNGKTQGYEVRLDDINNSQQIKAELMGRLDKKAFRVSSWYDLHKDLYSMMQIERWAAYIIVSLIIAIAAFNVLGSLAMSVIEKKKDIGILRSMGAKDKSVLRIFMFEGMLIGLTGTLTGGVLGVAVVMAQKYLKFYSLDPGKYIIDALPVELRAMDFLAVAGMALFLSFLASLYPARRSIKVPALEAIKWE